MDKYLVETRTWQPGLSELALEETAVGYRVSGELRIEGPEPTLAVAPGQRSLLSFSNNPIDMREGVHVNLYNNVWGTAFPQWYEQDMRFRFVIRA